MVPISCAGPNWLILTTHSGRTDRLVEVKWVEFPELEEHWVSHPESGAGRAWLLSVARTTETYFQAGGQAGPWMQEFQAIRQRIVKTAWKTAMADLKDVSLDHIDLVAFGSSARAEDLLYSDLDHGVLLSTSPPQNFSWQEAVTQGMRRFARTLMEFGFPPCHGYVMGLNDRWFGTQQQWLERVERYASFPDWEQTRYLLIMLDGRSLSLSSCSDWPSLWERVAAIVQQSAFLQWEAAHLGIAATIPSRLSELSWTGKPRQGDVLDIKERVLVPIIHSLRLWGVAEGCKDLSSEARLAFLRGREILHPSLLDWIEVALHDGWRLRLQQQATCLLAGRNPEELLRWGELSAADQIAVLRHLDTVQELVRQVKRKFRKPRS